MFAPVPQAAPQVTVALAAFRGHPEATRDDILGLLSMLLERLAVSPRPAVEGTGGEHGASA